MRQCPECSTETSARTCPRDGRPTVQMAKLSVSSDPLIGRVIAEKYRLERRLGGGAFGAVYLAQHLDTGGHAAVKLLQATLLGDENAVRRFYVEAQNTHRLRHYNTIRLYDVGRTNDGLLYLVMEYVRGRTLRHLMEAQPGRRLAPARAVHIVRQVLKSLGEAHSVGLVHRDVKPENIMITDVFGDSDVVKVVDFGISRSLHTSGLGTRGPVGTPSYMSPEQWRSEPVDGRADLYAVGCMLYRMLAGKAPFRGDAQTLCAAHLMDEPKRINEVVPGACPEELDQLVLALLAKPASERPPSATAVLHRLAEIQRLVGLPTALSAGRPSSPSRSDSGLLPTGPMVQAREPGGGVDLDGDHTAPQVMPALPTPSSESEPTDRGPARRRRWWLVAATVGIVSAVAVWGFLRPSPVELAGVEARLFERTQSSERPPGREDAGTDPLKGTKPVTPDRPDKDIAGAVSVAVSPDTAPPGRAEARPPPPPPVPPSVVVQAEPTEASISVCTGEGPEADCQHLGTGEVTLAGAGEWSLRVEAPEYTERQLKIAAPLAGERVEIVSLQPLSTLELRSEPKRATVRWIREDEVVTLGRTPFTWSVPEHLLRANEPVRLRFSKRGYETTTRQVRGVHLERGRLPTVKLDFSW